MVQANRKGSSQTNRLSVASALDDRTSQGMSESGNTSASRTSSLSDSSGPDEEKPKMNPLKQFETEDFPPEQPLDASRTSLVFDDDFQDGDPNQNTLNHIDPNSKPQLQSETVSELIVNVDQRRSAFYCSPLFWLILIAVMLIPAAVLYEMQYGLISGTKI